MVFQFVSPGRSGPESVCHPSRNEPPYTTHSPILMKVAVGSAAVCLLLILSFSISGHAQSAEITIRETTYTGDGDIPTVQAGVHIWQSESHTFQIVVETQTDGRSAAVCLESVQTDAATDPQIACRSVSLAPNTVERISVTVEEWPANLTGQQTLRVTVRDETKAGPILAQQTLSITVLRKTGDRDVDGLTNEREVEVGTNITDADSDADRIEDRLEIETYGTDPLSADTDGDELTDGEEVLTHTTDPRQADTDDDGLSDGVEINEVGSNPNKPDTDGDGLSDAAEVNTYDTDPAAADTDGDGLGDGLEVDDTTSNPTATDTDSDGLSDGEEVTIFGTDPTKRDTDGDGLPDAAEIDDFQTDPSLADTDRDGLSDGVEVNTYGSNPNSRDTDSDGTPDGKEVNQGTDPTAPTANTQESVVSQLLAIVTSERMPLLLGGSLVVIGAIATYYYRSGRQTAGKSTDPSVMTNRERILQLLAENDGRMLQSDIVDRDDWSKATVSRVLSEMEADGAVTRIDIGKGNLVSRPGDEPETAKSSHSE